MPEGIASTRPEPSGLHPGAVVGGRFEVIDQIDEDPQAVVWSAKDQQTKRAILVRVIRPELVSSETAPEFREACRNAATLSHRNIARVFGVGRTPKGEHFIAGEWIDGTRLSDFIQERDGDPISLRGIYNVVAHLCSALSYAHEKGPHGTLRPSVVWVTRGGRVKVHDFGVGQVLLGSAGSDAFKSTDHACLAPEVKRGEPATPRSDVFGIGAILYELLDDTLSRVRLRRTLARSGRHSAGDGRHPVPLLGTGSQGSLRFAGSSAQRPTAVRHRGQLAAPARRHRRERRHRPGLGPAASRSRHTHVFAGRRRRPLAPPPPPKRGLMSMINQLSADTKQRWMVAQRQDGPRAVQRPRAHRAAQHRRLLRRRPHLQHRHPRAQAAARVAGVPRIHPAARAPRHHRSRTGGPRERAPLRKALCGHEVAHRRVGHWSRRDLGRWLPAVPFERPPRGRCRPSSAISSSLARSPPAKRACSQTRR